MPAIVIKMGKGKTTEQKRALVKGVTEAVSKAIGADPEHVQIEIFEMDRENLARGGKLNSDR